MSDRANDIATDLPDDFEELELKMPLQVPVSVEEIKQAESLDASNSNVAQSTDSFINPVQYKTIHVGFTTRRILDIYIANIGVEAKALKQIRKEIGGLTQDRLRRILSYPESQAYLQNALTNIGISSGISRERWERETMEYRDHIRKADTVTCFMHKLIGVAKGYVSTGNSKVFQAQNQQIIFEDPEDSRE